MSDVASEEKMSIPGSNKLNLLIQLHFQLSKLLLPPGVESNLGGGVAAGLLQLLVEVVKLPSEGAATLVRSSTRLAFSFKLFVKLERYH